MNTIPKPEFPRPEKELDEPERQLAARNRNMPLQRSARSMTAPFRYLFPGSAR